MGQKKREMKKIQHNILKTVERKFATNHMGTSSQFAKAEISSTKFPFQIYIRFFPLEVIEMASYL